MMKIREIIGDRELARVFVAELSDGAEIEFVESVQPPKSLAEKWVLIISTLKGCPVGCPICDAGGHYKGKLTAEEIFAQIETLIRDRFPCGDVPTKRLKIQFARMGDPALNDAVNEVLDFLPERLSGIPLQPSISTVAPVGREKFFDRLLELKNRLYSGGSFQMQFSVHTTDMDCRRRLVPINTWNLSQMAAYGDRFVVPGDLKLSLNFALAKNAPFDPEILARTFSPERFLIKLTPINPTRSAARSGLLGRVDPLHPEIAAALSERLNTLGFETIVSIGETAENEIGSNCGMYVNETERQSIDLPTA